MKTSYDETLPLRQVRAIYFRDNHFGDDGGYTKKWVTMKFGPLPFAFPNSAARVRAVRYHDLHHVVTGYDTTVVGEAEIGAWEIGSGCADHLAAWVLNLYAMVLGFWAGAVGEVWRAFLLGRRTRNLYRATLDEALLDAPLGQVRARLGLDDPLAPAGFADRVAFTAWSAVALALWLATAALLVVPLVLLVRALL